MNRLTCALLVGLTLNLGLLYGQASSDGWSVNVSAKGLDILARTPVDYPEAAKSAGLQGNVAIVVTLDASGNVTGARVMDPGRILRPAPEALQRVALEAVRKWRLAATTVEGDRYLMISFQTPSRPMTAVQNYLKEGYDLVRAGQNDKALSWYEEGEKKFPEIKLDFLKREAEVYIRQGNRTAIKAKLDEIFKESPQDVEARGLRASIKLDEGDLSGATVELTDVVKAKPDNFVAHFNLGRAYFAHGDLELAQVQFSEALDIRPTYGPAYAGRAQIELSKGDYSGALRDADELLRLKPDDASGKVLRSAALARLHR